MCRYCIEYGAIIMEPEDANSLLPYFGTTLASLYRPGGNISADIALQAWEQEPDAETRLAIALILLLRDGDELLIKAAKELAASSDETTTPHIKIPLEDDQKKLLSAVRSWHTEKGVALLKKSAADINLCYPEITAIPSLSLAVWAGFKFDQSAEWEMAVSKLAENWAPHGPPTWSTALWLRREARLALWLAGREDTARRLDDLEDYKPVTTWIETCG